MNQPKTAPHLPPTPNDPSAYPPEGNPVTDHDACCRARAEGVPREIAEPDRCSWPTTGCWVNGPGIDPSDAHDDAAMQAMDAAFEEFPHDE